MGNLFHKGSGLVGGFVPFFLIVKNTLLFHARSSPSSFPPQYECYLQLSCSTDIVLYGIVRLKLLRYAFLFLKEWTWRHELHVVKAGGWDRV